MNIERLPPLLFPGFDCIRDNATCPACAYEEEHGRRRIVGNHGVSGGRGEYAVRMTLPDGRAVALVIEALGRDMPATVPRVSSIDDILPMGGPLSLHLEDVVGLHAPDSDDDQAHECGWMPNGRCRSEVLSYIGGHDLYAAHGSKMPKLGEQPEGFWSALEVQLMQWTRRLVHARGGRESPRHRHRRRSRRLRARQVPARAMSRLRMDQGMVNCIVIKYRRRR